MKFLKCIQNGLEIAQKFFENNSPKIYSLDQGSNFLSSAALIAQFSYKP